MVTTNVVVGLDDSEANHKVLNFAVRNLCHGDFKLHLVTVQAPVAYSTMSPPGTPLHAMPVMRIREAWAQLARRGNMPSSGIRAWPPMATAGAMTAMAASIEAQHKGNMAACLRRLQASTLRCIAMGVAAENIARHSLPAAGGASGVAESLVTLVNKTLPHAVAVIGNRGLGSWKRSMMSVIGLGSVGDYCMNNMTCPVIIVKTPAPDKPSETAAAAQTVESEAADAEKADHSLASTSEAVALLQKEGAKGAEATPLRFCVCVDGSDHATNALKWAATHLMVEGAELHIISIAYPVPLPFVDEMVPAAATVTARKFEEENQAAIQLAENACADGLKVALEAGVSKEQIYWKTLRPEGGASDVSESIVHYVKANGLGLCCVGRHGFSSWTRGLRALVGLGSVSQYLVHNVPSAVAVVKLEQGEPAAA